MRNHLMKRQFTLVNQARMRGFSLIEFMVASILSMIVLMAVGSGYLASLRLNDTAATRLQMQQDLRTAAGLITRDARMAGSFGCFNMGAASKLTPENISQKIFANEKASGVVGYKELDLIYASGTNIQSTGVKSLAIASNYFGGDEFEITSAQGLVFSYGVGSATVDKSEDNGKKLTLNIPQEDEMANMTASSPWVISSCNQLSKLSGITYASGVLGGVNLPSDMVSILNNDEKRPSVSVMKRVVNIYVIGRPSGVNHSGFYRFSLKGFKNNGDPDWSKPELLVDNVDSMDIAYTYNSCTESSASIKFDVVHTIKANPDPNNYVNNNEVGTPVMLHILLKRDGSTALQASDALHQAVNVNGYRIDAYVRGGNVCGNRTL